MKRLKRIFYIAVFLIICHPSAVLAGDDVFVDLDATLALDDNVTRASTDADIEYDIFLALAANFAAEIWRGDASHLLFNATLATEQFADFSGLTNYSIGGAATYTFSFSSGFGAPWFALNTSYRVTEFDSKLRDSNFAAATLTMGKRIDDRTDMRFGVGAQSRESDSRAFDNDNSFGFANLDLTVAPNRTLYLTYRLQKGDVVSTATGANISFAAREAAGLANEADDVFIGKRNYRLDATTQLFTIGYNRALDLDTAYDISLRYLSSSTDVDLEYEGLTLRMSYFQRVGIEL